MKTYDYIIVGAGSAGCVLAERLSVSGQYTVCLIEAGPTDDSIWYRMPKGFGKILGDGSKVWHFHAEGAEGNNGRTEVWHRGKTLGGSSSINGMVYMRGQPEDYDSWEESGLSGWGWTEMARCFKAIESHSLGADELRGGDGPLRISAHPDHTPLCDAFIAAGVANGLEERDDINRVKQEGVAYVTRTIDGGVRMSSARAFLAPNRNRANLTVLTGIEIDRIIFRGTQAVGVSGRGPAGAAVEIHAAREVILSAGAIQSPLILQRSGIGDAAKLQALGIDVLSNLPGVGANMREHYLLMLNYRLKDWGLSVNRDFSGWRLALNFLRYLAGRKGGLANGSHDACAFIRSRPGLNRADAQILIAPWSLGPDGGFEKEPGFHMFSYVSRPESAGTISITSADPLAAPSIKPAYLATETDRATVIGSFRFMRRLAATEPLAGLIVAETQPGPEVESDADILEAYRKLGRIGHHAAGTVKMGVDSDVDAVLDNKLRVRGVTGLRVMDLSVVPGLVSGNTNGPMMAMAWRASELILANAA